MTTGGSLRAVVELSRAARGQVVGAACLVDRSGGLADVGAALHPLVRLDIPDYPPEACPLCRDGVPLVRPKEPGPAGAG